jgi:hypothetical protein
MRTYPGTSAKKDTPRRVQSETQKNEGKRWGMNPWHRGSAYRQTAAAPLVADRNLYDDVNAQHGPINRKISEHL